MIRPPSSVKPRDEFYSRDPAFVQLPDGATEDEQKEHARKWRVSRMSGDHSSMLVEGHQPTKFTFRPLTAEEFGALIDMNNSGTGRNKIAALAFRIALKSVSNFGDAEVEFAVDEQFGRIATLSFLSVLPTGDALAIVAELGGLVLERASDISPPS